MEAATSFLTTVRKKVLNAVGRTGKLKMPKYPSDVSERAESVIPLLPSNSAEERDEAGDEDHKLLVSTGRSSDVGFWGTGDELAEREGEKVPWWSYIWDYDPLRSADERTFLHTLDIHLLTILSLGYFIKNLDSTNISNAYVSGMRESLHMTGNTLNLVDVAWTSGYVIGQIPSQFILTKIRPSVWIPSCELIWAFLTFAIAFATSSNQVIVIRFLVGLLESIFYPAAHFLLGSWYKPSELGKRACIFHASAPLASMFSGYLQAAVYKGMNGTLGKEGWQWLFVMDGLISMPIALAGYWMIPDLPENSKVWYLGTEEREMARRRMRDVGRAPAGTLGWGMLRRVFRRWHVYGLTILYVIFINTGPSSSVAPMALWLKENGWSVEEINIIPTFQSLIQLLSTLTLAIASDYLRSRSSIMTLATSFGFLAALLLAIWDIPSWLHWSAYFLGRAAVPYGPLAMSWANEICGADAEERSLVLGVMNACGYAFDTWLPLLTYPVSDSPRFKKGFTFSACAYVAQGAITGIVWWLWRRERQKRRKVTGVAKGLGHGGESSTHEEHEEILDRL